MDILNATDELVDFRISEPVTTALNPAPVPALLPCAWVPFALRMPQPAYNDPGAPGPTHGLILVTNNLLARNRWGAYSHVWLTSTVHHHSLEARNPHDPRLVDAYSSETTAYSEGGGNQYLRMLTHWRPAVPEEWEYDAQGLPTRCVVSADPNGQGGSR